MSGSSKTVKPTRRELYGLPVETLSGRSVATSPCPVCAGGRGQERFRVEGVASPVVACEGCGVARFEPQLEPGAVAAFYPEAYYGEEGRKFAAPLERLLRVVAARHLRFLARDLPTGARVLDVGCGRGVLLTALADRGLEVHGFDISDHAVRGADARARIRVADDLLAADYPEAGFERVILWHVFEHLARPRETLAEVHRILAPGGRLVIAVPNLDSLQARCFGAAWFHLDLPRHLHHFPRAGLVRLLADTGFAVESEHHFSLRQNPYGWLQSFQNRWAWLPRNGLYQLLHGGPDGSPRLSAFKRLLLYGLGALLFPPALALSVVAAALRSGATFHVVARRVEKPG